MGRIAAVKHHVAFVGTHDDEQADGPRPDIEGRANPFASFLVEALAWLRAGRLRTPSRTATGHASGIFASLQHHHASLNETGFPRMVSKRFLALHGGEVLLGMRGIVENVEREARYRDAELPPLRPVV